MSGRPASRTGGLAVYVTSHGFGHLNRTAAVLNRVPADVPITIKSNPNLFVHWRERLRRPAELQSFVSDVGAVNPPGDSAATDGPATIALAARVHAEALARLDDEVAAPGAAKERRGSLRCARACPCWRPAGGDSGLPDVQLHLGRHLRPLCQELGRRRDRIRPSPARSLPQRHGHIPRRAGAAHVVAFAGL